MSTFVMVAQLIAGLALLVFVHEAGHFLAARMFKIRVPKFYLFFNPSISLVRFKKINGKWRFKFFGKNLPDTVPQKDEAGNPVLDEKGKAKHKLVDFSSLPDDDWRKYPENTEYGIGWLPLGGYCQIAGMIDETQSIENMASEPQPWEYRFKPAWQRLIVVLGGVIVNLVVGVLLFAMVIGKYEKQYLPNEAVTDGIYAYQAARDMGFQCGDKIISVNGKEEVRFKDIASPKMLFGGIVTVERAGEKIDIVIVDSAYSLIKGGKNISFIGAANFHVTVDAVQKDAPADKTGLQKGDKILFINDTLPISSLGALNENLRQFANQPIYITCLRNGDTMRLEITPDSSGLIGIISSIPYQFEPYSFGQSIVYGWKDAVTTIRLNMKGFGKIFSGEEKATSLSGPIGIAQMFGKEWRWERFWYLVGLLSVILAFMNILPIPGLDGGHAIFATVELITRRKVSDKVLQYAQSVGMFILILLMVFVIGNDIFKLFR
ncbi:MAG: RIP metalloprotease RseP [Lentimicrobiaceae bacterium]|nr:RIP metalloprotease RseP [Lentimicrobiaceae bacterium]